MGNKKILATVMPKDVSAGNFTNEINLALVKFGLSFEKICISMPSGAVISGFDIVERTLSNGSHEYELQLVTEYPSPLGGQRRREHGH